MIPGTIEEWKAALASSEGGIERSACVYALLHFGQPLVLKNIHNEWIPIGDTYGGLNHEYRVKPTPRPWNAEDARRHVGFAYRFPANSGACHIIMPWHCDGKQTWTVDGGEYATPIPGTDPSTWDWKKCEVVE